MVVSTGRGVVVTVFVVLLGAMAQTESADCPGLCADYNCTGTYTLSDLSEITRFIYQGMAPCMSCYGVDGLDRLTPRDVAWLSRHLYEEGPPPICDSPLAAASVMPGSDFFLVYDTIFPAGVTIDTLQLRLVTLVPHYGYCAPMRVRIGGEIPEFVGSSLPAPWGPGRGAYNLYRPLDEDHGEMLIGVYGLNCCVPPGRWLMSNQIIVQVPVAPTDRRITIEWYDVDSLLGSAFFHRPPIALTGDLDMVEIDIGPERCPFETTGDANFDGSLSSSDIIYIVNYVFKSGSVPVPCAPAGDVNCDQLVSSSDIIYLVNHVFKSGPQPPCDLCNLYSDPWDCWKF